MPIVMVRGVVIDHDPRLHDLRDAVMVTGQPTEVTTYCGIKTTSTRTRLVNWAVEGETGAPSACTECRDLPPFWAD